MKGSFMRSLREEAEGQGGGEVQGKPEKIRLDSKQAAPAGGKKKTDCEISSDGFSHLARAEAAATFHPSSVHTAPWNYSRVFILTNCSAAGDTFFTTRIYLFPSLMNLCELWAPQLRPLRFFCESLPMHGEVAQSTSPSRVALN